MVVCYELFHLKLAFKRKIKDNEDVIYMIINSDNTSYCKLCVRVCVYLAKFVHNKSPLIFGILINKH